MTMNSRIGLLHYGGSITSINCSESYSRNILKYCYTTRSKVRELLDKGKLYPIEYKEADDTSPDPMSARTDANLSDFVKNGEYYNYLFDGELWTVFFNINRYGNHAYYCRFGFMEDNTEIIKSINYCVYNKPEEILTLLNKCYSDENEVSALMQKNGIGDVNIFLDDNDVEQLVFWPDPYWYVPPRIDTIPPYFDYPFMPSGEYCNFLFKDGCWTYYCQEYTTL